MTTNTALIIVDVQNDFCEGGALACAGGNKLARDISIFVREAEDMFSTIVTTQDWHNPPPDTNGGHFADAPDFATNWPVHCVRDSHGAELHKDLVLPQSTIKIFKGQGINGYTGFSGVTADGKSLVEVLTARGVTHVVVAGIATEFCVYDTAFSALVHGFTTTVLIDLCVGVSDAGVRQAITHMRDVKIRVAHRSLVELACAKA